MFWLLLIFSTGWVFSLSESEAIQNRRLSVFGEGRWVWSRQAYNAMEKRVDKGGGWAGVLPKIQIHVYSEWSLNPNELFDTKFRGCQLMKHVSFRSLREAHVKLSLQNIFPNIHRGIHHFCFKSSNGAFHRPQSFSETKFRSSRINKFPGNSEPSRK